jgi:Arc/MetJ family transcription regulator
MYKRTNIEIDVDLVREVMETYSLKSMKDAINFSLEKTVEAKNRAKLLKMRGKINWEGDLDEMRKS